MAHHQTCRIAIIGMGPRGLGAAEAVVEAARREGLSVFIEVFDPGPVPGAGPNFSPRQNPLCILNIPNRAIEIPQPQNGATKLPDFQGWLPPPADAPERFPPRAELGGYFMARLRALSLRTHGNTRIEVRSRSVRTIERSDHGWWIATTDKQTGPFDEVLLTPGQPRTKIDPQLARWQDHAETARLDLVPAYPDHALLKAAQTWAGKSVGIRGLGLSTLDVLRLLTCGLGGRLENGTYRPSGREPARILPFSLNGHPPVPKPLNAGIDQSFDPLPSETKAFVRSLTRAVTQDPGFALETICAALNAPALRLVSLTGDANETAIDRWLATEREDPGAQETRTAIEALQSGIRMAQGIEAPSVGYVVGQIWRKWQDELRRGFNPAAMQPETSAALVRFDEGLKRYSYGPPVSSSEELLMLIDAGIVDLRAVEDPDILLTETGWRLVEDDATADVNAMVDAVLPSPDLEQVSDALIAGLRAAGTLVQISEGLGARTQPDGQVVDAAGNAVPGLALLGRMALGSVIAVDSIHDCFGAAADRWAEGVVVRATEKAPA